jgi:hypothetical protein
MSVLISMSDYTPEQIEQAKEWLESGDEYDKDYATCILAALSPAEQERDALAAYAAKLEKAGDKIRNYKPDSNQLQAETDIEELFDDWDAARKEKP